MAIAALDHPISAMAVGAGSSLVERLADCAMHMVCGARGKTAALHFCVEHLRMFRDQPFQAVSTDSGYEVLLNVNPVASMRVLGYLCSANPAPSVG